MSKVVLLMLLLLLCYCFTRTDVNVFAMHRIDHFKDQRETFSLFSNLHVIFFLLYLFLSGHFFLCSKLSLKSLPCSLNHYSLYNNNYLIIFFLVHSKLRTWTLCHIISSLNELRGNCCAFLICKMRGNAFFHSQKVIEISPNFPQ